ncbi:signal peptide peptidase SppA [Loktanella atrilutea]|uniref:Signal peptide peptidase SppA n=1 Tax=Loktanella atrilutea TaxID=366533 RepID=A0A1M4WCH6_LOKAT|nr:S49 family peptidase [Loktanella atrilutea]SHE78926.1 signal peptide peptidase SppA [Loktanella atrilutea]
MTGIALHQIAERAINRPLMLHPDKARIILSALDGRLPGIATTSATPVREQPEATAFYGTRKRGDGRYALSPAANGVAVISIVGSLVNRGSWIGAASGLVSYEGIGAQLDDAASDREVKAIILDIDSPGGEALGMAGLAAKVRAINAQKPVVAVVNDMAASAAYGIASGAGRIVVSQTSLTGSIGVVLMHADRSDQLAAEGVAVTLIHAGAHKVDGHPFGPLSDAVRSDLQSEVLKHYGIFLDTVAAGRGGRLSREAAQATEARVYLGEEAIGFGLADEVGTFEQVAADLAASTAPAGGTTTKVRTTMSQDKNSPAAETTPAAPDAAALNAARAEGATAERARIKSILTSDAAKGREGQAQAIALETDMTAEQAAPVLNAAAPGAKPQTIVPIDERVGAEAGAGGGHTATPDKPKSSLVDRAKARFPSNVN